MEKSQYSKVFWFFFSKKIRFPYACRIDSANRCNRPVGARGKKELLFEKEAKTFTYSMRVVPHRTHQQVKVFCFFSSEKKTLLFLPRHPGGMKQPYPPLNQHRRLKPRNRPAPVPSANDPLVI
jgi:hypothetical protein